MTPVPTGRRWPRAAWRGPAAASALATTLAVAAVSPATAAIPLDLGDHRGAFVTYAGASPQEEAGAAVSGGCDLTGDGVADTVIGAPSANVGAKTRAGRVSIVPGASRAAGVYDLVAGGSNPAAGAIAIEGLASDHQLGNAVACAGDVNGDGRDDLLIGARGYGGAFVVFGGAALGAAQRADLNALGSGGFRIDAPDLLRTTTVAAVGDVDGDGLADVAIGDEEWFSMSTFTVDGAVFVVPGQTGSGTVDLSDGSAALLWAEGDGEGDALGAIAAAGDVDGDGRGDVVFGARRHDGPGATDAGAAYVVSGRARGKVPLGGASPPAEVLKRIWGPAAGAQIGGAVAGAGQLGGSAAIAIGMGQNAVLSSPGGPHRRVWVVRGGGAAVDLAAPGAATVSALVGPQSPNGSDDFGRVLVPAGDLNGDGRADLAVGARTLTGPQDASSAGGAFLLYGRESSADLAVSALTCEQGARLLGEQIQTQLGASLAVVGGRAPQLLVGAGGNPNGSRAHVVSLADVPGACGDREPPRAVDLDVDFGLRTNFRRYVFDGFDPARPAVPISASGGATCDVNPDPVRGGCDPHVATVSDPEPRRALRWTPIGAGATDGSDTTVATIGKVTFRYPGHFFTLNLSDPWFVVSGSTVTVRARVDLDVAAGFAGARSADVRVNLGTYPLAAPTEVTAQHVRWTTDPGTLTDEAAAALGGFLGRAAVLDPVTITIPRSLGPLPEEPQVLVERLPIDDPPVRDPGTRDPIVRRPLPTPVATIVTGARRATVTRNGGVLLGTVVCHSGSCRVSATKRVRIATGRDPRGRKRFATLRVSAPATVRSGKRGQVRLAFNRTAAAQLAGRTARVRVTIAVRAQGRRIAKTVTVTLRGAKPSSKARRR